MKRALLAFAAMASSALAVDVPFTYTGSFSAAAHPSIEGAVVATFTSGGTLSVTNLCKITRILAVGGGGGGGGIGGGGGGGVADVSLPGYFVADGSEFTVVIGAGGAAAVKGTYGSCAFNGGTTGGSSSFGSLASALGGSGGGGWSVAPLSNGANGGGGSPAQNNANMLGAAGGEGGHKGGNATCTGSSTNGSGGAGGGGGAGGDGGDSGVLHHANHNDTTIESAGAGGIGLASDITGETVYYGGGGGGGVRRSNFKHGGAGGQGGGGRGFGATPDSEGPAASQSTMASPLAATAGTDGLGGGGGGGGWDAGGGVYNPGKGGDGIVIVVFQELSEGEVADDLYIGLATFADHPTIPGAKLATFHTSGTFMTGQAYSLVRLLVVGGGGGGVVLGGGAGGSVRDRIFGTPVEIPAGASVRVVVGEGGDAGDLDASVGRYVHAGDGGASSFGNLEMALGGGGAGGWGSIYVNVVGTIAHPVPGLSETITAGNGGGGSPARKDRLDSGEEYAYPTNVLGRYSPLRGAEPMDAIGHKGGNASNYGDVATGCGGGGGGAGAGGDGGNSGVSTIETHNDTTAESAGAGGIGIASDITGVAVWYGGGGGGGIRRSNFKFGGEGGLGGGGRGFGATPGAVGPAGTAVAMASPLAATAGTDGLGGGGGGGGWDAAGNCFAGMDGGDGVVIAVLVPRGTTVTAPYSVSRSVTGGYATVLEDGDIVHTFTDDGPLEVRGRITADILLVGGGGGGGAISGGGGGGGQVLLVEGATLRRGTYDVVIGEGGAAGTMVPNTNPTRTLKGSNGGTTSLGTLFSAIGGGAGAGWFDADVNGLSGASGGGAAHSGTTVATGTAGHDGGISYDNAPAGGGGAGAAGGDGVAGQSGSGGDGVACSITGTEVWYGGGGGGGWTSANALNGSGGKGGGGDGGCRGGTAQSSFARQNAPGIPGGDGRGGGGGGSSNGSLDAARGGRGFLALRYHPGPMALIMTVR